MFEHSWPQFSELLLAGSLAVGAVQREAGLLLMPEPEPVAQAFPPRAPALPPLRP